MRIIVDAMGGDYAPDEIVLGALDAAKELNVEITLVGRGEEILECLSAEEVAQLNAITEKLILGIKDKGVNGKKKGRKAHHHHCCHC